MKFFERANAILGMNARNLHYVGRYNNKQSKKFADDKIYTKNYLMTRGIGVAKIYNIIKRHKELVDINPKSLPASFVIKPNHGFGGEGIIVIKEHKNLLFKDVTGFEYSWKDLYLHIVSILDGKYSISGLSDQAILEETLYPHKDLVPYTEVGLPDIRIIVFNYVPVIAMLRLPTFESRGKANLHLGGIGIGINVATGKASFAVHHNKFVRKLPNGEKVKNIQLPMWDELLITAAKAQQASQVKFLAVDLVLTKTGIKILELNARAGLGIQIANQIPLKHRLRKVEDLKVSSPEKGVEISKALFSALPKKKDKKLKPKNDKKIIGLFEEIDILNTPNTSVLTKIDPHTNQVLFDESLEGLDKLKRYADVLIRGERVRFPFKKEDLSASPYKVIIGGKTLNNFLIDANLKEEINVKSTTKTINEKIIRNIDRKLSITDKELKVLLHIKPLNLKEEKSKFLKTKDFSPQFIYKKTEINFTTLLREVSSLPKNINHPLYPLFVKKIDEIISKIQFLDSVGTDDYFESSIDLYGDVSEELFLQAKDYIAQNELKEDNSKVFNSKQIIKHFEYALINNRLNNWKIKTSEKVRSISVDPRKKIIYINSKTKRTENNLKALLVHEIGTHVYRYENGVLQEYKIFKRGTGNYLETEEGLAIYNQKNLGLSLGLKDLWPAYLVIAIYHAKTMSFLELFHFLQKEYGLNNQKAWSACFRAKRGMSDTEMIGGCTRDAIYLRGYQKVLEYLSEEKEERLKNLYMGKIAISDIKYLEYLEKINIKHLSLDKFDF
ncbi:MAG: tyrosine/phenylalanine carboxypeptidase domain-containing protein [Candidatus Magasanikbacteria bacterium]